MLPFASKTVENLKRTPYLAINTISLRKICRVGYVGGFSQKGLVLILPCSNKLTVSD